MIEFLLIIFIFPFIIQFTYSAEDVDSTRNVEDSIITKKGEYSVDTTKNFIATLYPFGLAAKAIQLEFQYGLADRENIAAHAETILGYDRGDMTATGYLFELSYHYIFYLQEKRYPKFGGYYLAPFLGYSKISGKVNKGYVGEGLVNSVKVYLSGINIGYQYGWDLFTLNLITGLSYCFSTVETKEKDTYFNVIYTKIENKRDFIWNGIGIGVGIIF